MRGLPGGAGEGCTGDVNLTIGAGTWFGLIGANGSGKTSLLRAIAGRLPFAGGSCRIAGEETLVDRAARASRIGFAPPADMLPEGLRVYEALELVGGSMAAVTRRLSPLQGSLGLDAFRDRWIGDCSAGMRQRVVIALAFAEGQPLVILDEPFNWLDPVAIFDMRAALRAMVDAGLTLMTALHDIATLPALCDAGMMLVDGRVALALDDVALRAAARDPQTFERRRSIDCARAGRIRAGSWREGRMTLDARAASAKAWQRWPRFPRPPPPPPPAAPH